MKRFRFYLLDCVTSPAEEVEAKTLFEAAQVILDCLTPRYMHDDAMGFTWFGNGRIQTMIREVAK